MSKQKPFEKIAVVLRAAGMKGETLSPQEIAASFPADDKMQSLMYRISTYIYDIRKNGGTVKVYKDGRKVVGYELLNPEVFDVEGRPLKIKKSKPVAVAPVVAPVVEEVEETVAELSEIDEIAEIS